MSQVLQGTNENKSQEIFKALLLLGQEFYDICTGESDEEDGEAVLEKTRPHILAAIEIGYTYENYLDDLVKKAEEAKDVYDWHMDLFSQNIIYLWKGWDLRDPARMEEFQKMHPFEQEKALGLDKIAGLVHE